jgi:phage gp29-like protein
MRRERSRPGGGAPDTRQLEGQVAPPTQIERYPIIVGRNLTLETVSSRMRLCLTGYRQLYVDLLDELIERDPHCYAVVEKRATTIANAAFKVVAPALPEEETKSGKKRPRVSAYRKEASTRQDKADRIADECQRDLERVPRLKQHLKSLAWADYWALSGTEMVWGRDQRSKRWRVTDMVFLHSRRLSYPDPWNWDLYIWDQGAVIGSPYGDVRLPPGIFGWRVADYPGKFVVHSPQVRGNYPTREGLGRELAYWMVLKHIAARAAPNYLERFSNPPTDIAYATAKEDGLHRPASDVDIADARAAIQAGVMRAWLHPDSLKWNILSPDGIGGRAKVTFTEWMKYCDDQMTKAVLGSTLGTDAATSGSRALGDVQRKDTLAIFQASAETLANTLDDSYVRTWCELNYPGDEDLWPHIQVNLEDDPDPMQIVSRALKLAQGGVAVDGDKVAEEVGVPVVAVDDPDGRPMRPIKPALPTAPPQAPRVPGNTPEDTAAEAEQEANAATHSHVLEVAQTRTPQQKAAAEGQPAAQKAAPKPAPKVAASEAPALTFAQRHYQFLSDLRTMRDLGFEITDAEVTRLAAEHGVPAPSRRKST